MNMQKLATRFILAIAVLIALVGIWQPAAAKSKVYRLQAGETIGMGMQGLQVTNIPRGVSHVYLNTVGRSVPARFSHRHDLEFRAPALEVRFLNDKGGVVESINALIYVYFNIGKAERAQWVKSGMENIAILYASEQSGSWEVCPTFFFIDGHGSNETSGRLACLAPGSGYFALEREVIDKRPPTRSDTCTPTPTPPYPYPPPWEPATTPGAPEPGEAISDNGEFIWAKALGTPPAVTISYSVFVDGAGNVYTTGLFDDTTDFDPGVGVFNLTNAGKNDIFVSKLNSTGGFVWAKALGGIEGEVGNSIFVDAEGNVYVTGAFEGTVDFDPGAGSFYLTTSGPAPDIFVSKLSVAGDFIWAKALGGAGNGWGNSVFVDGAGDIYTTGSFNGTTDFDPGPDTFNLTSAGGIDGIDIFVSKLDGSGNFVWAKAFLGGTDLDGGSEVFVDGAGNVYTTGRFSGTVDFDPGMGVCSLTSAGSADIFISKLDSVGGFIWARALGNTDYDSGNDLFVDEAGNVYTTGAFMGTVDFDPELSTFYLSSSTGDPGTFFSDIFVSKLDSAGDFIWAKAMGGTDYQSGENIFVDEAGNVYTMGLFGGTADFDPGAGTFELASAGAGDIFVSKLDNVGGFIWAKALGGTDYDLGNDLFVDEAGNVYTTGAFMGAVDFDPGLGAFYLTSKGDYYAFVSKVGPNTALNTPLIPDDASP